MNIIKMERNGNEIQSFTTFKEIMDIISVYLTIIS